MKETFFVIFQSCCCCSRDTISRHTIVSQILSAQARNRLCQMTWYRRSARQFHSENQKALLLQFYCYFRKNVSDIIQFSFSDLKMWTNKKENCIWQKENLERSITAAFYCVCFFNFVRNYSQVTELHFCSLIFRIQTCGNSCELSVAV